MCIDPADNELETLQIIHHYVEILDRYFGNVRSSPSLAYFPSSDTHLPYGFCLCVTLQVCELDLIFNFHKV
jgi:hypothetical protein